MQYRYINLYKQRELDHVRIIKLSVNRPAKAIDVNQFRNRGMNFFFFKLSTQFFSYFFKYIDIQIGEQIGPYMRKHTIKTINNNSYWYQDVVLPFFLFFCRELCRKNERPCHFFFLLVRVCLLFTNYCWCYWGFGWSYRLRQCAIASTVSSKK